MKKNIVRSDLDTEQEDNRRPNPTALAKIFERMLEFEEEVRIGKRAIEYQMSNIKAVSTEKPLHSMEIEDGR